MQAVILAGGLGTRLRPITLEIPKPMVPINGKPYLHYQLEMLQKYNITDILILAGHLGHKIEEYFKNGKNFGINIRYIFEKNLLGTGGSIKNAERFLEDNFFIINGDSYLPINYLCLIDIFYTSGKTGLIVVYDNKQEDTQVINNISIDENSIVIKYKKNSQDIDLKYVDAGVSIFKKEVLKLIPENKKISLEEEIFPKLIKEHQLIAYITTQRFYDIGTPERIDMIRGILK